MPVDNANMLSSLKDIASLAYGSGTFEKSKGGEGYMGAFVDSTTGQVRVVKMLTHRGEYGQVKKSGGEANFAAEHGALAESTQTLRNTLLRIAESAGDTEMLARVKNLICDKPLLSRKIVAQAVNLMTEGLDKDDFSWKTVGREARTLADTTLDSVMAENDRVDRRESGAGGRFKTMSHVLRMEIADTVATDAADAAAKIRAGRFDQSWRNAFRASVSLMGAYLGELVRSNADLDKIDFQTLELNETEAMMAGDKVLITFHRVLRDEIAKDVENRGVFPLDDVQKQRIMARACRKAFIISQVKVAAEGMLKALELKFPNSETSSHRKEAIQAARARLEDPVNLSQGYDVHFGFRSLGKSSVNATGEFSEPAVDFVRGVMACDVLTFGDLMDVYGSSEKTDRTDVAPRVREGQTLEQDVYELFTCFSDARYTGAKRLLAQQMSRFVSWFIPRTDATGLDIVGDKNQDDLNTIVRDAQFEAV